LRFSQTKTGTSVPVFVFGHDPFLLAVATYRHGVTRRAVNACALANKLARICYAVLRDHEPYCKLSVREENRKTNRTAYAVAG